MHKVLRLVAAIWTGCLIFIQRQMGKRPAPRSPTRQAPVRGDDPESSSSRPSARATPVLRNIAFAPIPAGRCTAVPEKDNWERQAQTNVDDTSPLGAMLWIQYVDGNGASSERQISVVRFAPYVDGDLIIDAHCQARNGEMRTFLSSRVKQAIDLETGEILVDLNQWLLNRYQNAPHGRVTYAIKQHVVEIGALTFIARVAGKMSKKQREHIAAFIAALEAKSVLTPLDCELITQMVRDIEGTSAEYKCVKRSLKLASAHHRSAFVECAKKIVLARKFASTIQQAILKELIDTCDDAPLSRFPV